MAAVCQSDAGTAVEYVMHDPSLVKPPRPGRHSSRKRRRSDSHHLGPLFIQTVHGTPVGSFAVAIWPIMGRHAEDRGIFVLDGMDGIVGIANGRKQTVDQSKVCDSGGVVDPTSRGMGGGIEAWTASAENALLR